MDQRERQEILIESENRRWQEHIKKVAAKEKEKAEELQNRVYEPPRHLKRQPGESPRAHSLRIRQAAENGDDEARAEFFRQKGTLLDGKSWTNYDEEGIVKENCSYTPEEEASMERERRELGE